MRSMVQEIFHQFFIYLKRAIPELKFIIVGDFEQLPPVKCRLGNRIFEDSRALYELCDGNKLTLTVCRRSDDTLFNMVAPGIISKIQKTSFGNKFTDRHLAYTNAKIIQINKQMVDIYVKRKKQKPLELPKLNYDKNSQEVKLLTGTPIIAGINNKMNDIYNNELFTIKSIDKISNSITITYESYKIL